MPASSLTVMVQMQDQVTGPARQATKAVDNFTNTLKRSERGANQLGANMGKARECQECFRIQRKTNQHHMGHIHLLLRVLLDHHTYLVGTEVDEMLLQDSNSRSDSQ